MVGFDAVREEAPAEVICNGSRTAATPTRSAAKRVTCRGLRRAEKRLDMLVSPLASLMGARMCGSGSPGLGSPSWRCRGLSWRCKNLGVQLCCQLAGLDDCWLGGLPEP